PLVLGRRVREVHVRAHREGVRPDRADRPFRGCALVHADLAQVAPEQHARSVPWSAGRADSLPTPPHRGPGAERRAAAARTRAPRRWPGALRLRGAALARRSAPPCAAAAPRTTSPAP